MKPQHLARWALLGAGCALSFAIQAQSAPKVVFLSTQDEPAIVYAGDTVVQNARVAFQAAAPAGSTFVNLSNQLSNASTPLAAELADAQVLVLFTVYAPAHADRMAEVQAALTSNPNLTVLAFVDGCCQHAANINTFLPYVNAIKPWSGTIGASYVEGEVSAPLNPGSLYQASFAGTLPSMTGGWYSSLSGVPSDYALYLAPPVLPPSPPGPPQPAYGLFVPRAASNGGAGACLFMVGDTTQFIESAHSSAIANAFMAAALDPNGACAQPAAGVPDVAVSLSGPSTLIAGVATNYTLTVNSPGVVGSAATSATVSLPAGVTVVPGSLPVGCAAAPGDTGLTCSVGTLTAADPGAVPPVAGGSVGFWFRVVASEGAAGGELQAAVPTQADEVNTANNTTALAVTVRPSAAVPTLGGWALLALSGLLPLVARRRQR